MDIERNRKPQIWTIQKRQVHRLRAPARRCSRTSLKLGAQTPGVTPLSNALYPVLNPTPKPIEKTRREKRIQGPWENRARMRPGSTRTRKWKQLPESECRREAEISCSRKDAPNEDNKSTVQTPTRTHPQNSLCSLNRCNEKRRNAKKNIGNPPVCAEYCPARPKRLSRSARAACHCRLAES